MQTIPRLTALFAFFALLLLAGQARAADFNDRILEIARTYPTDGTHDYWWPRSGESSYDGCSTDIYLMGERVMEGEPEARTFCCGWTLEVFAKAYDAWLAEQGDSATAAVTPADWQEFQRLWFVVDLNGPGPSAALEEYGLGREIPAAEARPGDFVQLWRTPKANGKVSGHSVIFLDWARNDAGDPIGIRYISTQPSTDGIGETTEYFGPLGGLSTENTWFARVDLPAGEQTAEAAVE